MERALGVLQKVKAKLCLSCGRSVSEGESCPSCGGKLGRSFSSYRPGQVLLNKYKIVEVLGRGGMGTVYRARHLRLERDVALKFIHPQLLADPSQIRRFQREAVTASAVDHPNALRVFDLETAEDGSPFLVSELLQGRDFERLIQEQESFPASQTAALLGQVAEVLGTAHRQGIIHRDLKPQNIFLCESPNGVTQVKLLDFGLAKLLDRDPSTPDVTQQGAVVGTPHYMSPEQLRGDTLDPRSDLWAVGVVLYQMLTRHLPFQGSDPVQVGTAVIQDKLVKPSQRRPDIAIDPRLEAICVRCLSKDPDERFPHAEALALAFAEIVRPAPPKVARRRDYVLLGALLALVPALFLIWSGLRHSKAPITPPTPITSAPTPAPIAHAEPASEPASAPRAPSVDAVIPKHQPTTTPSKKNAALLPATPSTPSGLTRAPGESLFTYGKRLATAGDKTQAASVIEEFLREEPNNASAHRWLADLYAGMRRNDKARAHYQTFLALAPEHPEAERIRSKLAGLP